LKEWSRYNQTILESVGKCGTKKELEFISSISSYGVTDTLLLLGQAQSLYRFGLRGMTSAKGTQRMIDLLDNSKTPSDVMMYAAQYLSRAKYPTLNEANISAIIRRINNTEFIDVKSALVIALGKTKTPKAQAELMGLFDRESNTLVKCNVIRALKNFSYLEVQSAAFKALRSKDVQLAQTAAEFFYTNGEGTDGSVYYQMSNDSINPIVELSLLKAANKHISPVYEAQNLLVNNKLKRIFRDTTISPSGRAYALKGLADYGWNYKYIYRNGFTSSNPAIRTATLEALQTIATDPFFDRNFGLGRKQVKKELSQYIASAINGKDPAMKAVAAQILADSTLNFKELYENSSFLHVAKRNLKLPQETETLYLLQSAINTFDGTNVKLPAPEYNHPIDWDFYSSLSKNPQVRIETKKGDIVLDLYPLDAPGSTTSFLKLVKEGFYNGKYFHRMVPNFVIQGGCPRGDGYGGLDYSLRSEVSQKYYDEGGYLGMASAGPDTEGVQWFITHSATPHLDGRYTIFGKVNKGMDVVHNIQVGDIIETVKILN
jgi:cyclophilin family peptidyl-prolyl cis-trans isomerase